MKRRDLSGQAFGRLTVREYSHSSPGAVWWRCACSCGKDVLADAAKLRSGSKKSCGCLRRDRGRKWASENKTHGLSQHPVTRVLENMINRCYRPTHRCYEQYGGRGIKICAEWLEDRGSFYRWALENGWAPGLTIDRKDNDGNYGPGNCRFVTDRVNKKNTSRNRWLTWQGRTMTISEWSKETGIHHQTLRNRLSVGWPIDRVLAEPAQAKRGKNAA